MQCSFIVIDNMPEPLGLKNQCPKFCFSVKAWGLHFALKYHGLLSLTKVLCWKAALRKGAGSEIEGASLHIPFLSAGVVKLKSVLHSM